MLTTIDNPYNPFTDYNKWNLWDIDQGYNTSSYLARLLQNEKMIDEEYTEEQIDNAMQSIIDNDMLNVYVIRQASDYKEKINS